jgi:hypothetical protein
MIEDDMDIFYFAFGITRKIIKEVNPFFKHFLYPGITWRY